MTASLVVRFIAATSRYHMGERIPFELEFRGIADADYYFLTDSCGPFGRLRSEQVVVTPADAVEDPLASLSIGGSCLSSFQALDGTPLVIRGSLNDWVRFTRPGTYTVVVSSTRLQHHSRQTVPPMASIPTTVAITPIDTAWAAAQVFQAGGGATLGERGTAAWLIARYGSVALLPFVRDAIDRPLPGCDVEAALIVYLLKHDPAPAMRRLEPGLDRTAPGTCVAPPLSLIASRYWDSRTEAVATAYLMNGTVTVVMAGVEALRSNGSIGTKQSLLDRLARWSADWRGRDTELAEMQSNRRATPADIEPSIVNALFQNVHFMVTIEDAENVRRLCVTDGCRTQVDSGITARRLR